MDTIHFEQFIEEVRLQHPTAGTISATESPLLIQVDGMSYNPQMHLSHHVPFYLQAIPVTIRGDGIDYTTIYVQSELEADKEVTLAIQQGETVIHQVVQLDSLGKGILEICTQSEGDIIISHPMYPVRTLVSVKNV